MAHESAANFVRQSVGSSIGTNDPETIDVQDASAFPDPSTDQYDIVIWDAETYNRPDEDPDAEIVTVTSRDTTNNTVTVSRGQQLTNNTSHPSTSDVMITALSIADFKSVRAQSLTTDQATINQVQGVGYNGTNQTVSSGSTTKVELASTEVEHSDVVTVDTTNNNIDVDVAGVYVVHSSVTWDNDANWTDGDSCKIQIFVNGSVVMDNSQTKNGTDFQGVQSMYMSDFAASDTIDTRVFQDSGSSIDIVGGQKFTRLEVTRVG